MRLPSKHLCVPAPYGERDFPDDGYVPLAVKHCVEIIRKGLQEFV